MGDWQQELNVSLFLLQAMAGDASARQSGAGMDFPVHDLSLSDQCRGSAS